MLPNVTTDHHSKSHEQKLMPKGLRQRHQSQPIILVVKQIRCNGGEENCC
jgi:hypothetical protein